MQTTTLIDYLDEHAGALTALLTAVLILVTGYYAWQTYLMAHEMRRTRELSILPKLALDFHRLGPTAMTVAVSNVGPGPAMNVDVEVRYVPLEGKGAEIQVRWRKNLLAPGEKRDFLPPGDLNDNLNSIPATYSCLRLTGTICDAAGKTHAVDEEFSDLADWRKILGDTRERFRPGDPERRWAEAFANSFKKIMPRQ